MTTATARAWTQRRRPRITMAITGLGALLLVVGAIIDPRRAAAAYLTAYVACLAVVLGTLAMVMIARVTAATWFVVLRRQAEQVVATLPVFAVLFIPIILAVHLLYPWAAVTPALRTAIHAKTAYLNLPFFFIRAIIYWTTWIALGEMLRRTSLTQDRRNTADIERRLRLISAIGLPLFAFTVSFASFDWMMSLTPAWYSTIYGVNYFAGAMVGALALLAVITAAGLRRGFLPDEIGPDQIQQLAKLLLTFILFWAYIGYSQFIVIWSAEVPTEAIWYVPRTRGGWELLAVVLLAGHFAIPFCALLLRAVRRNVAVMALLGGWLLLMHYLDIYWIVMPDAARPSLGSQWLDVAALLFIVGATSCTWALRRTGQPMLAQGEPVLPASLEYAPE